jgi:hypothetical protein
MKFQIITAFASLTLSPAFAFTANNAVKTSATLLKASYLESLSPEGANGFVPSSYSPFSSSATTSSVTYNTGVKQSRRWRKKTKQVTSLVSRLNRERL